MDTLLAELITKFEKSLNSDQELLRRFRGFKNFSGVPDGHYQRARREGNSALVRAVRCYPFGGASLINECEIVGLHIKDDFSGYRFAVSRRGGRFIVTTGDWDHPHLSIALSRDLFKKTILGRYRWIWLMGMNEVAVSCSDTLPHSDWITILEILVVMQELIEFDRDLLLQVEQW